MLIQSLSPADDRKRSSAVRPSIKVLAFVMCLQFHSAYCVAAPDPNIVGFVLEVSGKWIVVTDKERAIKGGDQLPADAVVRPADDNKDGYLLMCLYDGSTRRYEKEQRLPKREKESTVHRVWSAVVGRYRGGVVQAASRGQELLTDGLVRMKDGQIDFAPLLGELPDGTWTLRLRPHLNPEKKAGGRAPEARDINVKWTAGEPAVASVEELSTGLYEVNLVNLRTKKPIGAPVYILVCSDKAFDKQSAAYEEAVKLTKSWKEDDSEEAAIQFLRAYMEELAEEKAQ